jgi:peptidoglycan-associated lipoprotein
MKKIAYLITATTFAVIVAGCSSTSDQTGAPIDTRTPGTTTPVKPGVGPDTGTAKPPTVSVGPIKHTAPDDVKKGVLAQRSVYFEFDSNEVAEKFRPMLQAHATYLSKNGGMKMMIQGNTDERGSREYNIALGQRRADSIKRMLVLMGAREGQVETVSFGEEKPRRNGKNEEDYAENRRGDMLYAGEF